LETKGKRKASGILLSVLLVATSLVTLDLVIVQVGGAESIWNMTFGGENADVARSVQQTSDGGYISAGFTESSGAGLSDFWLVKTNASGGMLWNRTYGGGGADEAYSVRQTSDGGYVIAGFTRSFGLDNSDFWLVKTEVDGAVRWSKRYGGVYDDCAFCVQQTSDMGYVVTGSTDSSGAGGSDFWLVKADSNGNMQWNKTFGGSNSDRAFSVAQTADGGYIIAGETDSSGAGSFDFWLIKTNSLGTAQWNKTYGGNTYDTARSVLQTIDSEYTIAGWTNSLGAGGTDFWLIKTDGIGNQLWSQTYGGTFDEEAYSVQQTGDGGYIVAGSTKSYGLYTGVWNFWLVKTDAQGSMQWNQVNGGSNDDRAYSVQQTGDGGYIVAGSTESYGVGLADFWLTKTAPHPPRPPEEGHDVAVIGVSPSKLLVGEGISVLIDVTVENQGIYDETSGISVYANETLIEASPAALAGGETATITFIWNTLGFAKGSYTISAVADQVLEEADTMDNTFVDGKVKVTVIGDAQGDGEVDISDLFDLTKAYGSYPSRPNWSPNCDFNGDNQVDAVDLFNLGKNYGQTAY